MKDLTPGITDKSEGGGWLGESPSGGGPPEGPPGGKPRPQELVVLKRVGPEEPPDLKNVHKGRAGRKKAGLGSRGRERQPASKGKKTTFPEKRGGRGQKGSRKCKNFVRREKKGAEAGGGAAGR